MKNVLALFSDAADAEQAIKKLGDAGLELDNAKIHNRHSIESTTSVRAMPSANTAVSTGSTPAMPVGTGATAGTGAVLTDDTIESYLTNVGIEADQISFFKHGVREGGNVVIIAVDDDEVEKAARVLNEAGGRAPQAG